MPVSVLPLFDLTPDEKQSSLRELFDMIEEIRRIIAGPAPLSVFDWSEALRLLKDAFVLANDTHEWYDDVRLATLFLYKGDCFRGLGRVREARDAYQAALQVETRSYEDEGSRLNAIDRLTDLDTFMEDAKARRKAGLWHALNHSNGNPDLSILGYETELWDPEPALRVQSVERWPAKVKTCIGGQVSWLKTDGYGFAQEKAPLLRSRRGQQIAPCLITTAA
ncbi:hypothetical protein JX266_005529 [Neoarthrinium moseri]|nr:hypothetical protein JX266_005529 [Neoarthrinium moseri]